MGRDAQESRGVSEPPRYLWGPETRIGLATAALTALADQAAKLWLIFGLDLAGRGVVAVTSFLDLVLTWNAGISYGLFQQETDFGRWALLAVKGIAVVVLWVWLARVRSPFPAVALGLIIGGAVGNAIDRLAYGAVADYLLFHLDIAGGRFNWYVFNLADVAIVAGVIGLLYESFLGDRAAKAP
jgi:signal peptidase II